MIQRTVLWNKKELFKRKRMQTLGKITAYGGFITNKSSGTNEASTYAKTHGQSENF